MLYLLLASYVAVIVAVRSKPIVACFFAFLFASLLQLTYSEDILQSEIYLSFFVFMAMYLALSLYHIKKNLLTPAFVCALISLYSFAYALDTIANYETQTWIWRNHESIVFILHLALMCVSIPKFNTILSSSWHNSFRVLTNMLHIQPYRHRNKRAQGEEGN